MVPAHPFSDDDALAAQLAARERASRADAQVLAPLRSRAAARALGLTVPPPAPPSVAAQQPPAPEAAAPPPPPPPPPAPPSPPPPTEATAPSGARSFRPAGVPVPTGGPAAVTTGVLAAAAAKRSRGERPLLELRPTVLATDVDRIGDQLVVLTDRLELRDRHGGLRRHLVLSDIVDVQVQRRLTSAVLVVHTRTATDMVIKGLRPEAAEEARAAILRLCPPEPVLPTLDDRALLRAIVELHRAGVLDDIELAEKTALVGKLASRSRRVPRT